MIVLAVILLGYISFDKLGMDLFPNMKSPRIYVEITSGERPPEEMEKQYVENIESLAARQSGVVQVTSITKVGTSQITVEYAWNKDMDEAFLDLQKALNAYSQNQDIDEMTITQHDPNTAPVMLIALTHNEINDMNEIRKVAENYIRNELVRLDGVAEVELSGEEKSEIVINTDLYRLKSQNISLDALSTRIQNFNRSVSGGRISEMGLQYIVKGVGLLQDVEDFQSLIVGYKSVKASTGANSTSPFAPVYLKDVATVSVGNKEPVSIVHINGKRCIGLSVYKETKYNTVKSVEQINEALVKIGKALPGYQLTPVTNQGKFIKESIVEVEQSALYGIILAIFVLFLFLRRIGTTFIVSMAIPFSIIATFNLMYFNNLTLNIMTLGGLALGAGRLIDDSIVVIENIFRRHEAGENVKDAVVNGTAQVGSAITASTLTMIVVFLPIVYLHGASGELFKDQAWTVTFSLLSSLFAAIFLIPMLYHRLYHNKPAPISAKAIQMKWYGKLLDKILKVKWGVTLVALLLMGASFLLIPLIGSEFMPQTESREFSIDLKLAEGTKLERTESTVENIEAILQDYLGSDLDKMYTHAGISNALTNDQTSLFEGENTAEIKVILTEKAKHTADDVIATINRMTTDIPDLQVTFAKEQTALSTILGTDEAPVVVEIKGEEMEEIENVSRQVKDKIGSVPGIFNIQSSIENGAPEVEVVIDRVRAGMYNLSISSIVSQIQDQLEGKSAGQLEQGGEMSDITIKLPETRLSEIGDLTVTSGTQVFRLSEIADIKHAASPKEIFRRNQSRIGKITAQLEPGESLEHVAGSIRAATADISLLPDYSIKVTGEEEKRQESMKNLGFALILSIILVYMVLASIFESLIHPFTVLLTIPFAIVGSILLFFILGKTFNIMAIIGVIMLVGIAVNNSIILIDRINQIRRGGANRRDAIILGGQQRLRPILMTTLTTILALIPLTIGFGQSVQLRSPMALAVIGGMITSTLMTLVVIPCVYDIIDRLHPSLSSYDIEESAN
jgi:hydrophobic/amphiphilic exporter-1 (mainly G- bacteria), HAE1 family